MSGVAKMHRIEILKSDDSSKIVYLVPEEKSLAIQTLIQDDLSDPDDELIDIMDARPHLRDPKQRIII